jgi:predicted phosphodiesterase
VRIAVVSDIHGNRRAFEAVLADLRETAPDVVFHGGDMADSGSSPVEIVDWVRDLGWPGVAGNTDEMLFRPESLEEFAQPTPLFDAIREMAAWTRERLGEERIEWLRELPRMQTQGPMALVHASPESAWRVPNDGEMEALGKPVAVYAHIHRPFIRKVGGITLANSGSVSLSYDGDRRAAYLLLDEATPTIRRVEYDVDREIRAQADCGLPHSAWVAKMLRSAGFVMPG